MFPVDRLPSPGPPTGPLYGETPILELPSTHKPQAYEPSPRFPSKAPMERGACLQNLLLHFQVPPNRSSVKRDVSFPEPSSHYLSQFPLFRTPLQIPQWDPYGDTCPQNLVHPIPWKFTFPSVPCQGASSIFPNRVHMDRDTPSPESLVCLCIHSCMSARVPKKEPSYIWEKHKITVYRVPRTWKAYVQWSVAWFPKGIISDTAISIPVPRSLRHNIFCIGLGRPEPR